MNRQFSSLLLITLSLCLNDFIWAQQNSSTNAGYHPSIAVIVGMLSVMLSIAFLILAYAKFCHGGNETSRLTRITQRLGGDDPWGGAMINSSARFSGIDRRAIELLPLFRFESVRGSREGLECAVCINRFEDLEMLRLLPKCKHAFHSSCIDMWLERHSTCPLCRYRFDPKDIASSRYSTGMRNPSGDIGFGIFVEREEDPNCRDESSLLGDERGGKLPSFHKFRHRIIVSELIDRSRWSDVNSSDLLFLRSEMIGGVSSGTTTSGGNYIVKIKEDIKRKRLFESIRQVDQAGNVNCPSSSLYGENSPNTGANIHKKKRCMSEISGVPRFALSNENGDMDQGPRSVWPRIMPRTLQWFGPEERNPGNSDDFLRINSHNRE